MVPIPVFKLTLNLNLNHLNHLKLKYQTVSAFITTLHVYAILTNELLYEGNQHVMAARLQSDSSERYFSEFRQICSGRFLLSLPELLNSERNLYCRFLIKENTHFLGSRSET